MLDRVTRSIPVQLRHRCNKIFTNEIPTLPTDPELAKDRRYAAPIFSHDVDDEEDNVAGPSNTPLPVTPTPPVFPRPDVAAAATAAAATDTATPAGQEEIQLDEEILQLLGDAPKVDVELGPNIHTDIAARWQEILSKGLPREVKEKLLKEHVIPGNCPLLMAPLMNAEVKAALPDALVKKDGFLAERQKQLGIALAALAQATQLLITNGGSSTVIKAVSDACRILCDLHYIDTRSRRGFAISATNTSLKETLLQTKRDKYLFGENITDKVKSAKTIEKSGADLKQVQKIAVQKFAKSNFYKTKALNTRALQRKTSGKPDAGRNRAAAGATGAPRAASAAASAARPPPPRARSPPPPPRRAITRRRY